MSNLNYFKNVADRLEDESLVEAVSYLADKVGGTSIDHEVNEELIHISDVTDEDVELISTGYKSIDHKIGGLGNGHVILIGGETCLRGDAKIYDPLDKTNYTVKERYILGDTFHVFAKDGDKLVIAKADPPNIYHKAKMVELTNGKHSIAVTPEHRVWTGSQFEHLSELVQDEQVLLPSILGNDLLRLYEDGQNYTETTADFQSDYHASHHLYGQLLQLVPSNAPDAFQTLNDVHEQFYSDQHMGGSEYGQVYIRPYLYNDHQTNLGVSHPGYKYHEVEWYSRLVKDISLLISLIPSLSYRFYSYLTQNYKAVYTHLSDVVSKFYHTDQDFVRDYSSYIKYTKWGVKQQTDDTYYDFNVPTHHNYFAEGLIHHNSNGKSALATNIACNVAKKMGVLFITLEMQAIELKNRLKLANNGTIDDLDIILQKKFRISYKDINGIIKNAKDQGEVKLVVLDYLQYLGRGMSLQEVSVMSKEIKTLALTYDIPLIVIVSLRKSEGGKLKRKWTDIEIEDFMGTGSIGYDCDTAMIASRKGMDNDFTPDKLYVKVLKTRNHALDYDNRYIELNWERTRITEDWVGA